MDAIETLMTEHRLIERTLDALVSFADHVCRSGADDRAELRRFATFIREFADAHHHGKEEDILFATMVEAGFPRHGGPIAVMLMEHEQGRAYVRALSELASQQADWSGADRQRLGEAAHGYANLLRAHIHKEDAILYPMAEQRLPAEALGHIDAQCGAYEARQAASGELARLTTLAGELHARHPSVAGEVPPRRLQAGGCC
ncbi:MAG TPA: hemerythrin domain-containing protein [Anaeromyxobacteraceae bacterium]|nr:hemerythrin domain-containing protein [Anaeromyxobacteraceae bacterium]